MERPPAPADPSPLFVKVDEAARLLGISRSLAYELANRWIESGCTDGIPAIRLGRRVLVNRPALERLAGDNGDLTVCRP